MLIREGAAFALAQRVRSREGAPLGEVFSFLSGLYFRGKLAYANRFAERTWIITTNRGLVSPAANVTVDDLKQFGCTDIHEDDDTYRKPLVRDAKRIDRGLDPGSEVVLLGSVATGKYVDVLAEIFGERLRFPAEFAGRGDMSRGGLMLRCVEQGEELTYVPIAGAARRGKRPPRLSPLGRRRIAKQ